MFDNRHSRHIWINTFFPRVVYLNCTCQSGRESGGREGKGDREWWVICVECGREERRKWEVESGGWDVRQRESEREGNGGLIGGSEGGRLRSRSACSTVGSEGSASTYRSSSASSSPLHPSSTSFPSSFAVSSSSSLDRNEEGR